MNQESIGKFMAALRKEKNLTQEQFAELLGVSNRTISRWETGRCMPDLSLLQIISDNLGVSVSELLNGRRMSEEEMVVLRDSINAVLELSEREKNMKKRKINVYIISGIFCFIIVILNYQFEILSFIFKDYVSDFVAGMLTGLCIIFNFFGIYNNNHEKTFRQRKREFLFSQQSE